MKKIILAAASVVALGLSAGTFAAAPANTCSAGDTGTASSLPGTPAGDASCTANVTLDVNEQVTIEGLSDIDMGSYLPAGVDASGGTKSDSFCIGAIGVDSALVKFESAGTTGFQMAGDVETADEITYTVQFDDGDGSLAAVTEGVDITVDALQLDNISCDTNGTTGPQRLSVGYAAGAFDDAEDNSYTDTITVTVAPN